MRKFLFAVAILAVLVAPVFAGDPPPGLLHKTQTDGSLEGGWVVSFPTGSSDYFNQRYDLGSTIVAGVSVASADFGSGLSYPTSGLFDPNFTVSTAGNTPDLASGISGGAIPGGAAVFNYVYGSFGGDVTVSGNHHVVVQLPPGDSGLLGVGANSSNPDPTNFDGWTLDGYASPSNDFSATADFGLNIEENVIAEMAPFAGHYSHNSDADESGDFITLTVGAGSPYNVAFHTNGAGALFMVWISFAGLPIQPAGPVLPTFPFGGGGFFRAGTAWPTGAGGLTLNFVAISGVPGVLGSVSISNEVTLMTLPDPSCNWGIKDDGTFETGWVVSIPSGSSDYFSNWYNCLTSPGVSNVTDMTVAVMDFATTATAYPSSGMFDANLAVDSTGWTPDLGAGFGVQPFTFTSGTFSSSSSGMVTNDISPDIPYGSFADDNIHGVIQFPPGDSGLLGVGGDTTGSGGVVWGSTWTLDGYATPSNRFDGTAGWGIRAGSN